MKPLSILFAGESTQASLIDKTSVTVFVRAMPQRFLGHVLNAAEYPHALAELCSYLPADPSSDLRPPSSEIPPPVGWDPVPPGWTDNLTDESVTALYELAKKLNFRRAVSWAEGQIAAKKLVAPLSEKAIEQVLPLLLKVIDPLMRKLDSLSNSTPSAPSSPAGPANGSSMSPLVGLKR